MRRAIEYVQRFPSLRALVIGDVMLDSYLEGVAARICSEAPVPVVRKTNEERVAGGAGNTAVNLRALGADVDLIGIVGSDLTANRLRSALRDRGVNDRWLVQDERVTTHLKLRIVADDQYVVRFDEGDIRNVENAAWSHIHDRLDQVFPSVDVVIVSDYNYGTVSGAVLDRLRTLRSRRPVPLIVDSKNQSAYRNMGATVVTPNLLEAQLMVGQGIVQERRLEPREIELLGRRILEMIDSDCMAITLGADGVLVMDRRSEAVYLPARAGRCASDIGAGDAFVAGMSLSIAAGAGTADAGQVGIEAAGIAVASRRTAVTRYQKLLQRLSVDSSEDVTGSPDLSARALARVLDEHRRAGRTIVFTNGIFDVLHAGHVQFLREAKELGDVLVVGVNSDRSLRRIRAAERSVTGERQRLALAAALDPVDYSVLFDEATPVDLIRILTPDVHVKGGDYAGQPLPEAGVVEELGGRVVILPLSTADTPCLDGDQLTSHMVRGA